jgi:putative ABC transport system substrate-binding protein
LNTQDGKLGQFLGELSINHDQRPMNRRDAVVALLALGIMPPAAWAQRVFRIGVLINGTESTQRTRLEAFRAGLQELGYIEGKNLSLSVRWNEGSSERLPDLADELLREKPDVLVASPVFSAAAAHKRTQTVPIVMAEGVGALQIGIVQSLAHPGGNVTGVTNQGEDLTQKQVELLKTIAPGISGFAFLTTGKSFIYEDQKRLAMQAAEALNLRFFEARIGTPADLQGLASMCGKGGCQALLVATDPSITNWRAQVYEWAERLRLPAVYPVPGYAKEGGLIGYGANPEALFRRAATYVDKILKGAKPGDLPIEQPTKFDLAVNLKAAKAIGITIPQSLLLRADEIIQ